MKYIIFSNPKGGLLNLLLLNIVIEHIKKNNTIDSEITLICWNLKLEETIYFDKNNFKFIINIKSFKNHYSTILKLNKDNSKKTIIDLSESLVGRLYNFFIQKNKKIHIKTDKNQVGYDKKAFYLIDKLPSNPQIKPKIKPTEYINRTELKKTTDYINWTLKSSGLQNLNKIRFVYILFNSANPEFYNEEMKVLLKFLNKKINLKVIITFQKNNQTEINYFIDSLESEIKSKIIGREFWNCDKNFIINLILNSSFIFTDDEIYDFYATRKDRYSILIGENEKKSKTARKTNDINLLKNRISYLIKNC